MTTIIGITGGIASGKSTIARLMEGPGITHLDADKLVHRLLAEDAHTIALVSDAFPGTVRAGTVDRKALGLAVAGNAEKLAALEQLLHPRVRAAEETAIAHARETGQRAVLLDIPLLFETGAEELCDWVIAATAPLEVRRERALSRGMPEATFARFVARQLTDDERNARADAVIDTGGTLAHTEQQVQALLKSWEL